MLPEESPPGYVFATFVDSTDNFKPILWGFFANPRMHVQTIEAHRRRDALIHVWLEKLGKRTFEVDQCPEDDESKLVVASLKQRLLEDRKNIEKRWLQLMFEKLWIRTEVKNSRVHVIAYSGYPCAFSCEVALPEVFQRKPRLKISPSDVNIKPDTFSLSISIDGCEVANLPLEDILWHGDLV